MRRNLIGSKMLKIHTTRESGSADGINLSVGQVNKAKLLAIFTSWKLMSAGNFRFSMPDERSFVVFSRE